MKQTKNLENYAETLAFQQGYRWTPMRQQVYQILLATKQPLTAYQLLDIVSKKNSKDIKPATIYRALEALQELKLIGRIETLNAFLACDHPESNHQHVFLVCDDCGHTDEIADNGISDKMLADALGHGFQTKHKVLELHGACKDCQ